MIMCPLCNEPVRDETDTVFIYEDDGQDFQCHNTAKVSKTDNWCHYARMTYQGTHPDYMAIIPPFYINWYEGSNRLLVRLLAPTDSGHIKYISYHRVIYEGFIDKKDLPKIYDKYKNLKLFT